MDLLETVLSDLQAESRQLDAWLSDRSEGDWLAPTPAEGWTVAHQVAHLMWTDRASLAAIGGDEEWSLIQRLAADVTAFGDAEVIRLVELPPDSLLHHWRTSRDRLVETLRDVPSDRRIGWFGPAMGPVSMATARLMETWAHGHDIAVALGIDVPRTTRVRHVCDLAVRTRAFSFELHDLVAPEADVRVELTGPGGEAWQWGAEDAANRISGEAWDFALLATRRLHRADAAVTATGAVADQWLDVAQAYAGPAASPPAPR